MKGKWFFAYGISTSPECFKDEIGEIETYQPACIPNHRLQFANYSDEWKGGTSCITPSPGSTVIGVAYLITDDQLKLLVEYGHGYKLAVKKAQLGSEEIEVYVLLPSKVSEFVRPSDAYVARIREGLTHFYPVTYVDSYLKQALDEPKVFKKLMGQWVKEAVTKFEYNCMSRRLYPWKGSIHTPWGCAWAVVAPGTSTTTDVHDEEETAIVLSGRGEVAVDDEIREVIKGDVVYFPPFCKHTIHNISRDRDLEVLCIWWGGERGIWWSGKKL